MGDPNMSGTLGQGDIFIPEDIQDKIKLKANPELDNFLVQVDEISEVINALASNNPKDIERGFRKADILLRDEGMGEGIDPDKVQCEVKANRSVINKIPDEPKDQGEMGTQVFMKMMEKDAQERAQNRKERKVKSDEFRKKGNVMFSKKDFAGALCNYNEAIKLIKDSPCLYNNRALTYLRLGIFTASIEDCKRALDLEEFSLRARMFMAKAHFLMGEAEKCREILEEARQKLPGHLEMINDYENELFNMGTQDRFDFDLEVEQKWKTAAKYELEVFPPGRPDQENKTTQNPN